MRELTPKQEECYQFMLKYLCENHRIPPIQVIADHFNIAPNAACSRIDLIVRKGWIERFRSGYKFTNIRLVPVSTIRKPNCDSLEVSGSSNNTFNFGFV